MYRTPRVAFINYKITTSNRIVFRDELSQAPIKNIDKIFLEDILSGMSYKELSVKHNKSISRISQWKRELYDKLADYYRINGLK